MIGVRKIVHIDMDAFYASVEQRDDPSLRGRPVVVGGRGARSVVAAASYEARRFGVRSAMPSVRAERLCPDAVFLPPDFARYRAVSRQVRTILLRHTTLIEPLSLDEAYLDVSTNLQNLPSATAVAEAIRASIREELQLTASAGVAPSKFLAKLASDARKPDGLCVVRPRDIDAFLLPLPVGALPGVGRVTNGRLEALGIRTVADLRAAPRSQLEARFGRWGARLSELAHGIDDSPVRADRRRKSISAEDTLPEDLPPDALAPHIARMADRTWRSAAKAAVTGRTVVLKLKTADFRILTRSLTLAQPPASAAELADTATALLSRVAHGSDRYRLIGVGLANLDATADDTVHAPQAGLFAPGDATGAP